MGFLNQSDEQEKMEQKSSILETDAGEHYKVDLPVFEGPLDLLLHLIRKHEVNIFDIPVSLILDEYTAYLEWMKSLNLDVAGEFLVIAATLTQIKSRMLLPAGHAVDEDEQEEEDQADPRDELVKRLLEYQRYKDVAEQLRNRPLLDRDVFVRGGRTVHYESMDNPFTEVSVFKLIEALNGMMQKASKRINHDILVEKTSIAERIQEISEIILGKENIVFQDLFADGFSKYMIIVTFLSILEMARLKMIRLQQADGSDTIYVSSLLTRVDDIEEALRSEKLIDQAD